MSEVIKHLKSFNRKERFILLHEVLGYKRQTFRLGPGFREKLGERLRLSVPRDSFVAMDYHLDWIQMALYLSDKTSPKDDVIYNDGIVVGNQRDVDLLVAFADDKTTHLVLVEAKGDTGWTNSQLDKKAKRFSRIFEAGRPGVSAVEPHFVMMSPRESHGIKTAGWPGWMKPSSLVFRRYVTGYVARKWSARPGSPAAARKGSAGNEAAGLW